MTDSGDGRGELGDLDPPDVRQIKIERAELTYQSPISTARGPIDHREVVVLTLTDGEGRIGLGEAAPLANFTPELVDKAELAIHRWADDGTLPVVMLGKRRMIHAERLRQKLDADCAGQQTNYAPGVVTGETPCPTNVRVHRTGGPKSPRREAVRRLDALLGR